MKVSEAAKRVIDLSRKIHEYNEVEYPKHYPNYPLVEPEEVEGDKVPPPPEEKELSDFLSSLSEEMLRQLLLIKHFGWGGFGPEDLAVNYEKLKETVGGAEEIVFELMTFKETLAADLLDGLEELHKHNIDVDKLPMKKIKGRKR